eukprot:1050629-Rhodomonas_salina.2
MRQGSARSHSQGSSLQYDPLIIEFVPAFLAQLPTSDGSNTSFPERVQAPHQLTTLVSCASFRVLTVSSFHCSQSSPSPGVSIASQCRQCLAGA